MGETQEMPENDRLWIDVWFFSVNQVAQDDEHIARLADLLQRLGIEHQGNALTFPERIVMTIHANRTDMLRTMASSGDVVAFAPCPTVGGILGGENRPTAARVG